MIGQWNDSDFDEYGDNDLEISDSCLNFCVWVIDSDGMVVCFQFSILIPVNGMILIMMDSEFVGFQNDAENGKFDIKFLAV